jgi:nucleotide-binding universal stress UspA family protein
MSVQVPAAVEVFDRIVCAVDESAEALEAARQAARLRSADGLLRVASVAEVNVAVHAGYATSHVLGVLEDSARSALRQAIEKAHPDSTHLLAGDPVAAVMDAIERFDATLVAVGPHGHSRAAGIVLGGVSASMLHDAPCSVLLARRGHYGPFPASIIAGVDGSQESLAAASVARSVAERFDAELVVVGATGGKQIDLEQLDSLEADVVTDPRKPVEALVDLSEEADLLVVGSRGLHGLPSLGSVSEQVAHRAASSVLVVREHVA